MIYLLLAILCLTSFIITLKLFDKFKINNLQAISINYVVAAGYGFIMEYGNFTLLSIPLKSWFPFAIVIAFSLIIGLYLFALTTQYAGIAIAAISGRMAIVIPILLGFLVFNDKLTTLKVIGIVLALFAFFLTFLKKGGLKITTKYYYLPFFLFLASGFNVSAMKFAQHYFINDEFVLFLATAFSIALVLGIIAQLVWRSKENFRFRAKNIVGGVILGLLNWWTLLFFLKGLSVFDITFFVPIYYAGVIALSSLIAYFVFKEHLRPVNWVGIGLAIFAILLLVWG